MYWFFHASGFAMAVKVCAFARFHSTIHRSMDRSDGRSASAKRARSACMACDARACGFATRSPTIKSRIPGCESILPAPFRLP